MTSKDELRAEIRMLRAELDEMRRSRAETADMAGAAGPDEADTAEPGEPVHEAAMAAEPADETDDDSQFEALEKTLGKLVDDAGKEIADRPLVAVLGAFVVGLLAGRMLSR